MTRRERMRAAKMVALDIAINAIQRAEEDDMPEGYEEGEPYELVCDALKRLAMRLDRRHEKLMRTTPADAGRGEG